MTDYANMNLQNVNLSHIDQIVLNQLWKAKNQLVKDVSVATICNVLSSLVSD